MQAITTFLSSKPSTEAIVPNKKWVDELNSRLARKSVILGRRVYTPADYLREKRDALIPIIGRGLKRHLVRSSLASIKRRYFSNVSSGTVKTISIAIGELKKNGILPDELEEILSTRGGAKEGDLLETYRKYQNGLASRGWHDEEDLWNTPPLDASNTMIMGFQERLPWMDKILKGAVFFEASPEDLREPQIFSLNSPYVEAEFVSQKIKEYGSAVVYLQYKNTFAWQLAGHFEANPPARPWTSNVLQDVLAKDILPDEADPREYASVMLAVMLKKGQSLIKDAVLDFKGRPRLSARALSQIERINNALKRVSFEWETIPFEEPMLKEEFVTILRDELTEDDDPPANLPFRLAGFQEAGLYEDSISIIPIMNDGYMPPKGTGGGFFAEPDTFSPHPDERIRKIFPAQEEIITRSLASLRLIAGSGAIITFHTHASDGGETAPSPFIVRFKYRRITNLSQKTPPPAESTGAILKDGEARGRLKKQLAKHIFSPSQLEEFGRCPFAYFCRYILGLKALEEKTPDVRPKDRGTLIHKILERFFKKHGGRFLEMKIGGPAADVVSEVFAEEAGLTSEYNQDMVRHLKERSARLIAAVLEDERETLLKIRQRPAYFEHEFCDAYTDGIVIKGKIDRIDTDEETFTVIDYKTGDIDPVRSGIEKGVEFQMPIYSEMAGRMLKGKKAAAAFLYSTKKKRRDNGMVNMEYQSHVFGKDERPRLAVNGREWDRLIELARGHAERYAGRIRGGCFKTNEEGCGGFCDWKDACRI